jgi:hypothetical protein
LSRAGVAKVNFRRIVMKQALYVASIVALLSSGAVARAEDPVTVKFTVSGMS